MLGTWVQAVAQSWLVFQLTDSAFLLGLVGFLSSVPVFILSLFAGVVADRVSKKAILLFTQHVFMLLAFALAVLTQLKLITPAQIMFIAVLNGTVMAFDAPARQAVVVELTGKRHLLNAIALNSAAFNSARVIGPALAGILISSIGMSGCFYLNGISFVAVIIALFLIKTQGPSQKGGGTMFIREIVEGLSFIGKNRVILILVGMVAVTSLFGISYVILMPVFAKDILKVGVGGLGVLMSSAGCGALVAALMLARLGDLKNKGRMLAVSSLVFSAFLVLFSLSKNYAFSLFTLAIIGWASVTAISLINTLLQQLAPDRLRGRLMSVFMFTFAGIMPFGNLMAGALSQAWGASLTVLLGGAACVVFFAAMNLFYPEIRKI